MITIPSRNSDGQHRQSVERVCVSVKEAAYMVGISDRTVWALIGSGELKSAKIGKRILIPIAAIHEFVESKTKMSDQPAGAGQSNNEDEYGHLTNTGLASPVRFWHNRCRKTAGLLKERRR